MSRNYNMSVTVGKFIAEKATTIREAAKQQWNFDGWAERPRSGDEPNLIGWGDDRLCAGESEEEFVDRLCKVIWQANGTYCEVEVQAVYLDDLPHECYFPNRDDYRRLMEREPVPDSPAPS